MPHAILASMGTDGDIYPYVGLGLALRRRGHRVTLVAAEDYRDLALDSGFAFRPLVSSEENHELLDDPDFWHPLKGPRIGARWGVRFLPRQYQLFSELARDPDSIFIANPAMLAARLVRETLRRPLITPILQPWMLPSCSAPPVMPAGLSLPRWAPRPLGHLYWRAIDYAGQLLLGRHLNVLRDSLGLPPVRRVFQWWLSPDRIIGMFPEWYGPPQADWLPQIRLTGFPNYGGPTMACLADDLISFCEAGPAPVVFTFGTGMMHATDLFRAALDACQRSGIRAIFLTKFPGQLPQALPPSIHHATFAPFQDLFPRCAAVVHHGGIGTLARCFAAGTPQLILPVAFDQKDNAIRVRNLGAGDWIRSRRATGSRIAKALEKMLTAETRTRCADIARRFSPEEDPLEAAAQCVEDLIASRAATAAGPAAPSPPAPRT
ncbi:MAG: glycosyl transferase family 28 [Phycisphaerales bacterium]|nr:glycosyl transferase family 28 [Phycisphaerales bacterium]